MGLRNKSKRREERRLRKRLARKAMKERYASYAAEGRAKRKGLTRNGKKRLVKDYKHPQGPCGNAGCSACHPIVRH